MADATPTPFDAEEWRPVVGYEGLYEISDHGRVRRSAGGKGTRAGKVLRFGTRPDKRRRKPEGYRTVALYRNGKQRRFKVHIIVLEAFIGPCPADHQCNHKDGDKLNNHVTNLEWVTPKGNTQHAYATGLTQPRRGERHPNVKLTDADVAEIRRLRGMLPQRQIGMLFGISQRQVSRIHRGTAWRE